MRWLLLSVVLSVVLSAAAQQSGTALAAGENGAAPLPPIRELLLQVERNERASEAAQNEYTYRVHLEEQDLDGKGAVKKTTITDSESVTIDGVRVDRTVARNGHPLTDAETRKESARIDKEVAKAKENRARRQQKQHQSQDPGSDQDEVLTASRILELGAFTHPRRIELDGRSTIVVDYAGDPNAKTRTRFESVVRDLVGTIWIDEQDRVLVRAQGHFLRDFKIGGGLLADIRSGSNFDAHYTKINHEVWLPGSITAQGRMRVLLLAGFSGRMNLATSDYRKFRTSSTIIPSNRVIGPDDLPVPTDPALPAAGATVPIPKAASPQASPKN